MKYIGAICLLLLPLGLSAACTGSSPTWTSTADRTSVASCVSSASRNDTINVNSGSATWATPITLTKGVTITGAGAGVTIITSSGGSQFFAGAPDATSIANGDSIKITGFTFDGNNSSTIFLHLQGENGVTGTKAYCCYVILNNTFKNQAAGGSTGVITAADGSEDGQLRGVISGNTFDRTDVTIRVFSDDVLGEWSNTAFNQLAVGTSDNLFFENNTIKCSSSYGGGDSGWSETGQGGRLVMRYNTYNMANCGSTSEFNDMHGFQNFPSNPSTGTMISERYGNTYTNTTQYRCADVRGGIGMIFDNSFSGSAGCSLDIYGQSGGAACPSDISPTPSNYNPLVHLFYFWNNPLNGTNVLATLTYVGSLGCTVTENNGASLGTLGASSQGGWWNYNASCTTSACSSGIGTDTTAPTGTCTKGVGFWVASTPGATVDPNVIQAAKFYQCSATNTWTQYYTPYTYPHPLATTVSTNPHTPFHGPLSMKGGSIK